MRACRELSPASHHSAGLERTRRSGRPLVATARAAQAATPSFHTRATSGTPGSVGEVRAGRRVEQHEVGAHAGRDGSDVVAPQRRAPPAVAAQTASAVVIPISRTASAIISGIELVKLDPGLQSLASATVTPASSSRRASG